ncbi:hypothetical protein [Kitasatospora indigofera]|uniref:hypothetical protein n=1 Tax=Kitasatospora indigofera TaxID=67307 RepID=UPI0036928337
MTTLAEAFAAAHALADLLDRRGIEADIAGDPLHLGAAEINGTLDGRPVSLFLLHTDRDLTWTLVDDAPGDNHGEYIETGTRYGVDLPQAAEHVQRWLAAAGIRPGDTAGG